MRKIASNLYKNSRLYKEKDRLVKKVSLEKYLYDRNLWMGAYTLKNISK